MFISFNQISIKPSALDAGPVSDDRTETREREWTEGTASSLSGTFKLSDKTLP